MRVNLFTKASYPRIYTYKKRVAGLGYDQKNDVVNHSAFFVKCNGYRGCSALGQAREHRGIKNVLSGHHGSSQRQRHYPCYSDKRAP